LKNKIGVLLVSENEPSEKGGIERHCHNLIKLFEKDKEISMTSASKNNISHFSIPLINKTVFNTSSLKKTIIQSNCDIVHIHGFASFIPAQTIRIASELRKRIVYTAHYHPFNTIDNGFLGNVFFTFFLKPQLHKISAVITINKEDTFFFEKIFPNVHMIPNWLDEEPFVDSKETKRNMILYVGRTDANKGIDHLYSIPENKYEIHCVSNDKISREDFIVHKKISDSELYNLYSLASLVVVPSRYEAFSYVALESLMCGTPVVMSQNVRIGDYLEGFEGIKQFPFGDYHAFNRSVDETMNKKVNVEAIKGIFNKTIIYDKLKSLYLESMLS